MTVHNHPPYRPVCNERVVDGQLRGACMTDADVREALGKLDGTNASAVALMTGLSCEDLDELGGVPEGSS